MNVLVTGGAGFIGSHVVDALVHNGHEVRVLDNLSTGKKEHLNPRAKFYQCDIVDLESIRPAFTDVACVFHTAALARIQPSIENPRPAHDANATGTLNVLLAARDAGVRRVIYSASSSAYGTQLSLPCHEDMPANPQNPYAIQKFIGELYCRNFSELYGLETISLRYFNVYGPRQDATGAYATVVGIFLRQRLAEQPMTVVADGAEKRRDYTYVGDIVEGNILAMRSDTVGKGEVINLGCGKNYSVVEVAELIGGSYTYIPKRLGEALETLADNTKAATLLGWAPHTPFAEGVAKLKKEAGLI
ncbi:MAG: hypothetical protein A3C84_00160 [Candidatus Ryanbacteria bacterium RIFCSPHIGHO2_02_FULL_48_12]|uniref:NAD-dependent epimerase/dehydratase domain-containing protein n=1 Tax=Candidatus Ryanbacteria bacterium RIFCSPHIGHO2_01_FULL_48_27 TaxID=1802115 RepID=A0A1G2G6A7_9BACT|nr:MAG: hypothetical protein A2756_00280 [Candidatus Ryanbacteria bacterium RIFCSPHIGHO2_01_FULL_48_27]OGZ50389.1 MAG: hypothetical protein A3C84_00160 [Candidatus Ryanbacteria bacterium RIFCSPHIGHO2_02_FULL_48_12]